MFFSDQEAIEAVWKLEPTRLVAPFGRPGVQGIDAAIRAAQGESWRALPNERLAQALGGLKQTRTADWLLFQHV